MKISRIISAIFILILFVTSLSFNSSAINLDGTLSETEWKKANENVLVSSADTANCDISYGMVCVFCDKSASRIYIGFKAKATEKIDENSVFGAAFSVNYDDFIYVTTEGVSDYNNDKYDIEAVACNYSDSVYGVEIALGIKYGMSTVDSLRVRFVDASGSPSNIYTVDITDIVFSDGDDITQPVYGTPGIADDYNEKTTKERTTKPKTTKIKTTKSKTTKPIQSQNDIELLRTEVAGNVQSALNTTADPYGEETTVMTVREFELQKGLTYTSVCAIIVSALGICVAINLSRDKEKSKNEDKKKNDK